MFFVGLDWRTCLQRCFFQSGLLDLPSCQRKTEVSAQLMGIKPRNNCSNSLYWPQLFALLWLSLGSPAQQVKQQDFSVFRYAIASSRFYRQMRWNCHESWGFFGCKPNKWKHFSFSIRHWLYLWGWDIKQKGGAGRTNNSACYVSMKPHNCLGSHVGVFEILDS